MCCIFGIEYRFVLHALVYTPKDIGIKGSKGLNLNSYLVAGKPNIQPVPREYDLLCLPLFCCADYAWVIGDVFFQLTMLCAPSPPKPCHNPERIAASSSVDTAALSPNCDNTQSHLFPNKIASAFKSLT